MCLVQKGRILSEEMKNKISSTLKGKYCGEDSPHWNKKHTKETRKKISEKLSGKNHPQFGCTGEKSHNYGIKRSEETKEKISIAQLKLWQDSEYQRKMQEAFDLKPNKPETELSILLNKLFPKDYKYVGDFQFFLGGRNPDFMNINGQKKLIEMYGDYWHRGQNPQDRIDHFKQYGFNTLVIWEHELKESRLGLRSKLKEFHNN